MRVLLCFILSIQLIYGRVQASCGMCQHGVRDEDISICIDDDSISTMLAECAQVATLSCSDLGKQIEVLAFPESSLCSEIAGEFQQCCEGKHVNRRLPDDASGSTFGSGSIMGSGSTIGSGSTFGSGSIMGSGSTIGSGSTMDSESTTIESESETVMPELTGYFCDTNCHESLLGNGICNDECVNFDKCPQEELECIPQPDFRGCEWKAAEFSSSDVTCANNFENGVRNLIAKDYWSFEQCREKCGWNGYKDCRAFSFIPTTEFHSSFCTLFELCDETRAGNEPSLTYTYDCPSDESNATCFAWKERGETCPDGYDFVAPIEIECPGMHPYSCNQEICCHKCPNGFTGPSCKTCKIDEYGHDPCGEDAICIGNMSWERECQSMCFDYNQDSHVNVLDVVRLIFKILHLQSGKGY